MKLIEDHRPLAGSDSGGGPYTEEWNAQEEGWTEQQQAKTECWKCTIQFHILPPKGIWKIFCPMTQWCHDHFGLKVVLTKVQLNVPDLASWTCFAEPARSRRRVLLRSGATCCCSADQCGWGRNLRWGFHCFHDTFAPRLSRCVAEDSSVLNFLETNFFFGGHFLTTGARQALLLGIFRFNLEMGHITPLETSKITTKHLEFLDSRKICIQTCHAFQHVSPIPLFGSPTMERRLAEDSDENWARLLDAKRSLTWRGRVVSPIKAFSREVSTNKEAKKSLAAELLLGTLWIVLQNKLIFCFVLDRGESQCNLVDKFWKPNQMPPFSSWCRLTWHADGVARPRWCRSSWLEESVRLESGKGPGNRDSGASCNVGLQEKHHELYYTWTHLHTSWIYIYYHLLVGAESLVW